MARNCDPSKWVNNGDDAHLIPGRFGHGPAKTRCRECPLSRTSASGWLGGYTPENYVRILHDDADIACHMSAGFHEQNYATMRSCTGVAQYRANVGKLPRGANAADAVREAGQDKEGVFASPQEFLDHHRRLLTTGDER